MPITVNTNGILHEWESVVSNVGGVLHEFETVHSNDSGVLHEFFSVDKPIWKCTYLTSSGATASNITYTASNGNGSSSKISGTGVH